MNKTLLTVTALWWLIIWWVSTYIDPLMLSQSLPLFLLLLAVWYIYGAYTRYWRRWVSCFAALGIFSLIIEYIWTTTCRPYGCFEYTLQLWPEIWGKVPILLWLIWPVLVLSIWWIISHLSHSYRVRIIWWILWLLLLDLALDPVHVVQGIRDYGISGQRFGVPRSNYLWRVFSWAISIYICSRFIGKQKTPQALAWGWIFLLCYFWSQFLILVLIT